MTVESVTAATRERELTIQMLNDVMKKIALAPQPDTILIAKPQYMGLKAATDFQGRNWRRIKREVRKAMKKARMEEIQNPTSYLPKNTAFSFWRNDLTFDWTAQIRP